MEQMDKKDKPFGKARIKGLFSLFTGKELKSFFKKYIVTIVVIEIIIFMVCWLYQIGAVGYDRFGPVDTPFPWKVYFLTAFLVPVGITFLFGLFIIAFENLFFGKDSKGGNEASNEKEGKLRKTLDFLFHVPFLTFLLVTGLCAVLFYDFDLITELFLNAGKGLTDVFKILAVGCAVGGTLFGIIRLFMHYRIKKKEMDYSYRLQIADKVGVVWIEKERVVEKDGKIFIGVEDKDIIENKAGVLGYLPGINEKEDN